MAQAVCAESKAAPADCESETQAMRATGRIQSMSYGTIYITGSVVALFLSLNQQSSIQQLVMHVAASWGYVIYWVWHY
jgi:hypothetical protein